MRGGPRRGRRGSARGREGAGERDDRDRERARGEGPLRPFAAVFAVALAARLLAAWAIPHGRDPASPNCAPDEAGHLEVVQYLARGVVPHWPEVHSPYPSYVPVCYAPQALTLAAGRALGFEDARLARTPPASEAARGYPAARLGSALAGAVSAVLLALAARTWTGDRFAAAAAGLAAALYPQLVFLGAYVNGDVTTLLAFSALLLALARWARAGEGARGLTSVGLACGLVLLQKPYGFAFAGAAGLWVLLAAAQRRVRAPALAKAVLTGALASVPVLVWNGVRNGGDVLGTRNFRAFLAENPVLKDARAYPDPLPGFLQMTSKSSFGVFGNNSVSLPHALYVIAGALFLVGLAFAVAAVVRAGATARRGALFVAAGVVVNVALVFHMSWFVNFQPQGRYAMPAVFLLVLAALLGPSGVVARTAARAWMALGIAFLVWALVVSERLLVLRPCG